MTNASNIILNTITALDEIAAEREAWEQGAYKTSNEQLYAILARCLDIYQQMSGRDADRLKQRKELDERLSTMGFVIRENTNLATKIVRYVFRTDRKRSYTYARVILAAVEHHIDSVKLASFIRNEGGIEEVRRKQKGSLTPAQQARTYKAAAEAHYFRSEPLVSPFKAIASLTASSEGTTAFSVALVRNDGDGNVAIVYGENNATIVKQLLVRAGKKLTVDATHNAELNKERQRKANRAAKISAAA